MKFYRGCESLSFFISTYFIFLLHIIFICSINDRNYEEYEDVNKTLIIHKIIIFVFFIFVFVSHLYIIELKGKKNWMIIVQMIRHT